MLKINIEKIFQLIEPVLNDEGFQLIDLEYKNEQSGWVLRIYIDKEGGVAINDCAAISKEIGNLLEVENVIPTFYHLEVSSPGLNRPLRKIEHFQKVLGEDVMVKTKLPIESTKNFKAKLIEVGDMWIKVSDGIKETKIDLDNIVKANLVYNFG